MTLYIGQVIGLVGLAFAIVSFQKNTNKGILLFQILASLAFSVHFAMLGSYTGSAMNFIGVLRNLFLFNREQGWKNNKIWLYLIILIYIVFGIITYQNLFSILPVLGMIFSTVAFWIKNPKYTRFVMLPSSPCWLIYNIANKSIAGVLTELFILTSVTVAMVRFDFLKSKAQAK